MNLGNIIKAEKEGIKFLKLLKDVKAEVKINEYGFYGNKLTGALRRSSMDLTRALAELRKPS